MAVAALSPNSIMASPIQANPQVKLDMPLSETQLAQDAQKTAKKAQTDTIIISAQALKMADEKEAATKETRTKESEQREAQSMREDKSSGDKNIALKNALKAYAAAGQ